MKLTKIVSLGILGLLILYFTISQIQNYNIHQDQLVQDQVISMIIKDLKENSTYMQQFVSLSNIVLVRKSSNTYIGTAAAKYIFSDGYEFEEITNQLTINVFIKDGKILLNYI